MLLLAVLLELAANLVAIVLGSWAQQLISTWVAPTPWQVFTKQNVFTFFFAICLVEVVKILLCNLNIVT
jgi:hypothetical protein